MSSFGVIVCTYNRRYILEKCLRFWNSSRRLPDQFIVVDASIDVEKYQNDFVHKYPNLFSNTDSQYISTTKVGLTTQRNIGLKLIKTEIVCLADDDAFVSSDYVEKILEVFQKDKFKLIGGINGTAIGQFDKFHQKYFRFTKNFLRNKLGYFIQLIHVPKPLTKVADSSSLNDNNIPLINIDRLWGANMSYRTEFIHDLAFDENFKRYGLFEDVDFSVRVGKNHKLVCRLDATVDHCDSIGQKTRPADAKFFLYTWLNSTYVIEKIFSSTESLGSHRRRFKLIHFISRIESKIFRERNIKFFGNKELLERAEFYISALSNSDNQEHLEKLFVQFQDEIDSLEI